MMVLLVYLFGPDGAGKSTLARALAEELKGHGLKARVSWMRGTHTLASILAKFSCRFSIFEGPDNPYYGISIPSNLRRLWQLIEFISILPILFTRFLLPSIFGYVIAERYLPDFLVWLSLTTRDPSYLKRLEARFLLSLSAKTRVKAYITASEAELTKRRGEEASGEFLDRQIPLYEKLAKLLKAHRIDTTERNVKETISQLLPLIKIKA